jgi:hypothetical protein
MDIELHLLERVDRFDVARTEEFKGAPVAQLFDNLAAGRNQ